MSGVRQVRARAWFVGPVTSIAVVVATLPAVFVSAHDQPFSYLDLRLEPRGASLVLTLHRDDAAAVANVRPETVAAPEDLAALANRVGEPLASRLRLGAQGRHLPLRWQGGKARPERASVELHYATSWSEVPGRLDLEVRRLSSDTQHETFLNVYQRGALLRQDVLTAGRPATALFTAGRQGFVAVLATFVPAGIHHIAIGPDHVLFVIGLLLLGGGVGRVARIVTAFTLSHSVTLALAAFGIVSPPARLIEPLIALSIVYVGVENLKSRPGRRDVRVGLAFAFGLVHGFGFASVLREFGLPREALGASLFAFNAGVEIGQLGIVLVVAPVLTRLRERTPRLARHAALAGSWGVAIAGAFWFVTRALGREV